MAVNMLLCALFKMHVIQDKCFTVLLRKKAFCRAYSCNLFLILNISFKLWKLSKHLKKIKVLSTPVGWIDLYKCILSDLPTVEKASELIRGVVCCC